LWAIRIVAGVIGSESDYLNHIIKSFQKNYSIDVYSELNQCLEVSSIELESYSNSSNLLSINIPNFSGKEKDCEEEDSKQDKLAKFFSNVKVISSSKPDSF
jgi:CYTH domain-containing protein